jgi:hypothetical protein
MCGFLGVLGEEVVDMFETLGERVLFQGEVGVAWLRGGCLCFWGVLIGGSLCCTVYVSSSLALFVFIWVV